MHDLTLAARFSDQLALMSDGRIQSVGSPVDVLQDDILSDAYGVGLHVSAVDGDLVVLPAAPSR